MGKKPLSEQAVTGLLKNFFNKKRSVREHKRGFLISGGNWHNTKQLSFRKRANEDKKEDKLTKRGFLISGGNWFNTKQLSLRKRANEDKKEDTLTKRCFLITGGNWFNTKQLSLRKRGNEDKKRVKRDFKVTKGAHMTGTQRVEVATKKPLSEQAVTGLLKNFFNKKRSVREHKRGFLISGG